MPKTTAYIRDNRLTIMTPNARTASVMSIEMSKVSDGGFELVEQKDGGIALEFKPAGRKTGDIIAVYNQSKEANKALEAVFKTLSGGASPNKKKTVIGFILYILKIIGLTFLALVILGIIIFLLTGNNTNKALVEQMDAIEQTATVAGKNELPLGEAFPVDQYVETLERSE